MMVRGRRPVLVVAVAVALFGGAQGAVPPQGKPALRSSAVSPPAAHALASTIAATNATAASGVGAGQPCQCVASAPAWVSTARTAPKCIFIDLGAADGNTMRDFLDNKYGPVANCPGGDWEAYLVEANPRFKPQLDMLATRYPGKVHVFNPTAAYMCEAQTSFFLDTQNTDHNYWGSSMSSTHPDAQKSGLTKVDVNTVNVVRMIHEYTIPSDWVMLKMDIEGSEWDVVPCLAQSHDASLVDRLYLEEHPMDWQLGHTTQAQFNAAKEQLKHMHVDIPEYFSQTL